MNAYCPYCMSRIQTGARCPRCGKADYHPSGHHLPPGSLLQSRYVIGRVLGEGGFGITYLGLDTVLERKVAIKEYFPSAFVGRDAGRTPDVTCHTDAGRTFYEKGRARFLEEARVMAKLEQIPEIVHVLDFFPAHQTAYIVMEFLEGDTFRDLLLRQQRIPANVLLRQMEPVLRALAAAHSAGIIHRDISPDNIILLGSGQIKLLDFGCARNTDETQTMTVMLKHGYAPVEQYTGHNQGPWTDIYALCATLYCCLTGKVPPEALTRLEHDHVLLPPNQAGAALTPGQEQALLKGLAVMPRDRWKSVADLYAALYGRAMGDFRQTPPEARKTEWMPPDPPQAPRAQQAPQAPRANAAPRQAQKAPLLTRKGRPTRFPLTFQPCTLDIGIGYMIGIKPEGGALLALSPSAGPAERKAGWNVSSWSHLVSVCSMWGHMAGLRADGSVFIAKDQGGGVQEVSGWYDIVAIACGRAHTVGLRANGTVCAVPTPHRGIEASAPGTGECDVGKWRDIVAVAAGGRETLGLRSDGTVLFADLRENYTAKGWTDIVAITGSECTVAGLRSDGTVVLEAADDEIYPEVRQWRDIVSVKAGAFHLVGLRSDGTVVTSGENNNGQCDVSGWRDVVAIAAGGSFTAGIRADGTVLVTGGKQDAKYQTLTKNWVLRRP